MTARPEDIGADPGLAALVLIARLHGVAADPEQLRHAAAMKTERFEERDLILSARSLGLKARAVTVSETRLTKTPLPALLIDGSGQHCVLAACDA
ncbi:cysteine peptidase family C39 domain-containing protein, partial [Paraburkholderia sediminicola]|uniref:cysteine peptidase family C39 domain-containing protein n=1 Tax=Paraburkholderia sediminicola TaxID=458836 RepID=UPI0038B75F9C